MTQQSKQVGFEFTRGPLLRGALMAFVLVFSGACAAPLAVEAAPEPLRLPAGLQVAQSQHLGTLLSGPQVGDFDLDRHLNCTVEVVLLRRAPGRVLRPLASDLRLVAQLQGQQTVQGGSRLAVGARWVYGQDAEAAWQAIASGEWGDHLALETQSAVVPGGSTFLLDLSAAELITDPDNFLREWPDREPVKKSLTVGLQYGGDDGNTYLDAGFALTNLVAAEGDLELAQVPMEGGRPGGDFLMEEWILPEQGPSADGVPVLWLLPSPFELNAARTVAVLIRAEQGQPGDWDAVLESGLVSGGETSEPVEAVETEQQAWRRQVLRALSNVKSAREACAAGEPETDQALRGALVYACNLFDLSLGGDLCLTGDAAMLREWAALLPDAAERESASADGLTWDLERAAWIQLARTMVKGDLPDAMLALVLRHGGEAGNYPSTLEDAARNSIDVDTFERRLLQENRLFLEDASPAARVRAFDWLKRKGQNPPDWDPLDSKIKRREPLRPWLATFESGEDS